MREHLWKYRFPGRYSSTLLGQKMSTTNKQTKTKFGHIGGDKRNSLTKAVSPSPKVLQPRVKKVLPQSRNLSCKGEGEHVSKHPTSPTVWEATKGVHFSLAPPRVLNPNLHGGRGEWGLALPGERRGVWGSRREASLEQRNDMTTKKKLTVGKRTKERTVK